MSRTIRAALAVLCVLIIGLCAILILQKLIGRTRVDLTQEKIYTLSPGTRRILGQLNQPVSLKLYYARTAAMKGPDEIRFYNTYYVYVRDLLEEYVQLSHGLLKLEVIDPRRYTDAEEEATQLGLKRFPISEEDMFFFGLAARTELGKVKTIPFFEPDRQEFAEYDVSRLISNVILRDKKKLGVLSSIDVAGSDMSPYLAQIMRMQGKNVPKPWTLITQLRETYDMQNVAKDAETIPPDLDFLMVIQPKELPNKTLFAIDQYVMKGGRLVVFVDPYCIADQQEPENPYGGGEQKQSSDLNALLKGWGVEMSPGQVVVDRALALKASLMQGRRAQEILPLMQLKDECMNRNEVITAPLHDIKVIFAGALKEVDGAGVKVSPLLTTSATGNVWTPAGPEELQFPNSEMIRRAVSDGTKPVMLGCRITGKFRTNFPDGIVIDEKKDSTPDPAAKDKPAEESKPKKLDAIKEASAEGVILVFSDVDMISDILAYRNVFFGMAQVGDNAPLVFNALEYLANSNDLIAIRSRGRVARPFVVVDKIEREAETATADQVTAINDRLKDYQDKLSKLGESADEGNTKLIAGEVVAERKKVEDDIRKAKRELRELNATKRARIEALGMRLEMHNMIWAPAAVLLIAILLAVLRSIRARRYAARRASDDR